MKTELITVPTFTFNQGNLLNDNECEYPIKVDFYNGTIVLRQQGAYNQEGEVKISPKYLDALFKEIKRHKPEAEAMLNRP